MKKARSAFSLENLEPRLLFSADGLRPPPEVCDQFDGPVLQVGLEPQTGFDQPLQAQTSVARELVFVDARVDDYQQLIDDLKSADDSQQDYAFFILAADRDGITQISDILEKYQGVTAVHFISHGADGQIHLGDTVLSVENLSEYEFQIQNWQQALTEQADFLFYSCNLAQGESGKELLDQLSQLTSADVAASDDLTGHATLGGDWQLEYASGSIEAAVAIQQDWQSVLAAPTNTITSADFNQSDNTLILTGTGFTSIAASGDVKFQMDWSKIVWDINGDDGTTTNVSFFFTEISSAIITDDNTLTINLTAAKSNAIASTPGYGLTDGADTLDIAVGFSRDIFLFPSTTDALVNGVISTSSLPTSADTSINMAQDTTYTFSLADFDFNDEDGDSFVHFEFTSVETKGDLDLFGVDINVTDIVTVGQIGNLTYTPVLGDSGTPYAVFSFKVFDGTYTSSNSTNMTINVTANVASVLGGIEGATLPYTENAGATAITSGITVSDVDDTNIESAKVQISANYVNGEDLLNFIDTANITGSWDAVTGTLNLSGSDSLANYQAALRSVTYQNSSEDPSILLRTVSFTVNDGDVDSNTLSRTVTLSAVNDAPVVLAPATALTAIEQIALAIQGTGFSVSDIDEAGGGVLATLTVGEGTLSIAIGDSGAIIVSGNATGTVVLSGTIGQLNALLTGTGSGTVSYLNSSDTPAASTSLTVTVNDQGNTGSDPLLTGDGSSEEGSSSVVINITPVNDAPSVALSNTTTSLADDVDTSNRIKVADITVSDADIGTNTLTLNGTDAALFEIDSNVLYLKAATSLDFESNDTLDVSVEVDDATLLPDPDDSAALAISITDGNAAPTANDDNLVAVEDTPFRFEIVSNLLLNDTDPEGDSLSFVTAQPAHGSLVDNADGTLTYTPNGNFYGTDSFDYTITDTGNNSATGKAFIVVAPVGDTPLIDNVTTSAGVQSGLIVVQRNGNDGAEVTHFKITAISNGSLFLADGTTPVIDGDFITFAQGQAGLRFTPADSGTADGSFNVESSQDGLTVAAQSGVAVAKVSVNSIVTEIESAAIEVEETIEEENSNEEVDENNGEVEIEPTVNADNVATQDSQPGQVRESASGFAPFSDALVNYRKDFGSLSDFERSFAEESTTVRKIQIVLGNIEYSSIVQTFENLDIPSLSQEAYQLVNDTLDAIQTEISADSKVERTIIVSSIATSVGLSAGYVVWLLQGGSLLTSVLASLPAWHLADPLSILSGHKSDDEDDDSLEKIIEDGSSGNDEDPQPETGDSA